MLAFGGEGRPVSDTPLTDARECEAIAGLGKCVGVDFARTLERKDAQLRALLGAALEDINRIDWLDEHMSCVGGGSGAVYSFRTPANVESGLLREAIDAARKQEP